MDKDKLKAMELDKDVVEMVEYLNDNGFKTFASCDGVFSHHTRFLEHFQGDGYLLLDHHPDIRELLAYARQKGFGFNVSTKVNNREPLTIYGQSSYGDNYSINFKNYHGQNTQNMINMLHEFIDDKKRADKEYSDFVNELVDCVKRDDDKSELYVRIITEGVFIDYSYMKEDCKFVNLTLKSKSGYDFKIDLEELAKIIEDKFGITYRKKPKEDNFSGDIFSVVIGHASHIYIYFDAKYYEKIFEIINYVKDNEASFKTIPQLKQNNEVKNG